MSRLRKRHHFNIDVRKQRLIFAKCNVCESLKDLISKLGKHNNNVIEYEMKLIKHILHQESCKKKKSYMENKVHSIKGGIPMYNP